MRCDAVKRGRRVGGSLLRAAACVDETVKRMFRDRPVVF